MSLRENPKLKPAAAGAATLLILVGAYLGLMAVLHRSPSLNSAEVVPGKLIRSGQPETGDLDRIKERDGLGTILCLRGKEDPEVKAWAERNGVKLLSLQLWADDPPQPAQIGLFFDIMRGATVDLAKYQDVILQPRSVTEDQVRFPFPVLIHCEGGSDRAGIMVALYRVAFQGWSPADAKREMIRHFHLPFVHPALFEFLDRMAPRLTPDFGSRSKPEKEKPGQD